MRVFLGLKETAGYYRNLQSGLDRLGVESTLVDVGAHPFQWRALKAPHFLVQWVHQVAARRRNVPRRCIFTRLKWKAADFGLRLPLFVWAVARHDVFVFGFATSFFGLRELPLLRLLGKRVLFMFHGSDSRPPYLDGFAMAEERGTSLEQCVRETRRRKRTIARIERYADVIISYPLHSHLHERPLVFSTLVGIPFQPPERAGTESPRPSGKVVRILHSPSHMASKGTPLIRQAIQNLRAKGRAIDYVEVSGRPHAEVLSELERCDFVVDQVYSEAPMAGFATEAAFFGKPAVVTGYAAEHIRDVFPPDGLPSVHFAHPDDLELAIERLVTDDSYREELGKRAKKFVETEWSVEKVAERYLRIISGDIPAEWWFDPMRIRYVHGYGFPAEKLRSLLQKILAIYGREAFQLSEKPELERLIVAFSTSTARDAKAVPER